MVSPKKQRLRSWETWTKVMRPISQELAKKMDIKKRQRIFQFHNWDGSRPMAAMASGRPWSTFRMRLSGVVSVERCAGAFCNDLVEVPRTSISNSTWNSEHRYLTGIWQLISRYIQIYSYFPNINSSEFAISIPIGCRGAILPSWFCAGHIDWRALWSRLQEGGFRLEPISGETRRRSHWKIWENEVEYIIAKTAKTQNYVTVTQVHKKTQHSWTRTSSILLDFSLTQKKRDEKGRSLDDEMIWHFALAMSTPLVKCIWTKASLMGLCKWYTWAIMGHFERETSDTSATSINFGIIFSDPNDR